jgi:type VII secretion protein EccE
MMGDDGPGVERIGAAMSGGSARTDTPGTLTARIRPGYLGTLNLGRPLLIEVVLVLVLAALTQPRWVLIVVLATGLPLTVAALTQRQGRWWTERVVIRSRYRRRRAAAPDRAPDPRLRALRALAPGLRVTDVTGADGSRVGVGTDPAGWFAAAVLVPGSGPRGDAPVELPFDRLARLVADSDQPGAVLQVVIQTTPAPSSTLDPRQRCATSYRELLERFGPVPAHQAVWLAVRLDAHALATAGVGGTEAAHQAPAAVAALARRVHRALDRSGVPVAHLNADGLLEALTEACDLTAGSPARVPREEWRAWATGRLAHTCYWVRQWPAPDGVGALLRALAATPSAATTISVVLEPGEEGVELRCLVRVSALANQLPAAATALFDAAQRAGARLLRLDGEQALAVYATAPTGGGAR